MAESGCLKDGHFQNVEVDGHMISKNQKIQLGINFRAFIVAIGSGPSAK